MSSPRVTWKHSPFMRKIARHWCKDDGNSKRENGNNDASGDDASLSDLLLSPGQIERELNGSANSPVARVKRLRQEPIGVVCDELAVCLEDSQFVQDFFATDSEDTVQSEWQSELTNSSPACSLHTPNTRLFFVKNVAKSPGCLSLTTDDNVRVTLSGGWQDITVRSGDHFHLVSQESLSGGSEFAVDSGLRTLFVLLPGLLLSGTAVADAVSCLRRSTLAFTHWADPGVSRDKKVLVVGLVLHDVFERALSERIFSAEFTVRQIEAAVGRFAETIVCLSQQLGVTATQLQQEILAECKAKAIGSFAEFESNFVDGCHQTDKFIDYSSHRATAFAIGALESAEETICSFRYGIKGKLDATVRERQTNTLFPFELKTGSKSSSTNHLAQTTLYSLILSDRYPNERVTDALLFYLGTGELLRIPHNVREIAALLMTRNRLASNVSSFIGSGALPPKCDNVLTCRLCPFSVTCETFESVSGEDKRFLAHWNSMIGVEEEACLRKKQQILLSSAEKRASSGTCIYGLLLANAGLSQGRSVITFRGKPSDIASCWLVPGDAVVVSTDDISAVFVGRIIELSESFGTVCVSTEHQIKEGDAAKLFCLDRDESLSAFGLARSNLIALLHSPLKDVIVTGTHTVEENNATTTSNTMGIDNKYNSLHANCQALLNSPLNENQANILARIAALPERSFLLVHGMPGTGKTTTIARTVEYLVQHQQQRVLLAGFTHVALDAILLKLSSSSNTPIRMLRLGGGLDKVHPALHQFCLASEDYSDDIERCAARFQQTQVVGCTVLGGLLHPYMQTCPPFDVCIVDEASQILLPLCLGPVLHASRFVLVGDPHQLPPITVAQENRTLTLFDWLSERYPQSVVRLSLQYRMNEEIMRLSNALFYDGHMQCADSQTRTQRHPPVPGGCGNMRECWFCWTNERNVAFLDTCGLCPEQRVLDVVRNDGEARLVVRIIERFCSPASGIAQDAFGIITPYRAQLKLIDAALQASAALVGCAIERFTIDKYQGKDKDTIVISLVRSNPTGAIGDLLHDWRRLNVALTRARKRLILVGDFRCLTKSGSEFWGKFGQQITDDGNLFTLRSLESC